MTILLHALASTTLVVTPIIIFILLATPLLEKKYTAGGRYILWVPIMIALALPFVRIIPNPTFQINVPIVSNAPATNQTPVQIIGNTPTFVQGETNAPTQASPPIVRDEAMPILDAETTSVTTQSEGRISILSRINFPLLIMIVWLAGIMLSILYQTTRHLAFDRLLKRRSVAETDPYVISIFHNVQKGLRIRRKIRLVRCKHINAPMLAGLFQPTVILADMAYNHDDLVLILRHELIHYKRLDLWYKLALIAVKCVYWFNPLIYKMTKQADEDIEVTCDAQTVRGMDNSLKKKYSELILAMASGKMRRYSQLSTCMNGGKKVLKQRFSNILGAGKRRGLMLFAVLSILIAVAACSVGVDFTDNGNTENDNDNPADVTETSHTGQDAAIAFLSQFPTLFSEREHDGFGIGELFPAFFTLYDLNESGYPDIIIEYVMPQSGRHGPWFMYRHINGAYRRITAPMHQLQLNEHLPLYPIPQFLAKPMFFMDENGRFVKYSDSLLNDVIGYWYVHFDENGNITSFEAIVTTHEQLGGEVMDYDEWLAWWQDPHHNARIPNRSDSQLTPLRLTTMEQEITTIIQASMDAASIQPPQPNEERPAVNVDIPDFITIRDEQFSTALTSLDLTHMNLTNEEIEPLRYMVNLTELIIQNSVQWAAYTSLTDISPLAGLTQLTTLYLGGNRIVDITPLAGLYNLTVLDISGNRISDITPLAGPSNLRSLGLFHNQISDITPLASMTQLTSLSIGSNNINDINALAALTNLTFLGIEGNQISDISPLADMVNLTFLTASVNNISDLTPLVGLINLETLHMGENPISDLTALSALARLDGLHLYACQIVDVAPLSRLVNLEHINLFGNQITDVTPLASLPNVSSLFLNENPVADWSPLAHLNWVGGRPEAMNRVG